MAIKEQAAVATVQQLLHENISEPDLEICGLTEWKRSVFPWMHDFSRSGDDEKNSDVHHNLMPLLPRAMVMKNSGSKFA